MIRRPGGIASQIALAALLVAGISIAILVVGVLVVGGQSFAEPDGGARREHRLEP